MKKAIPILFLTGAILLSTCKTSEKLTTIRDMSKIYNPGETYLHPRVDFYHIDEKISTLIVKLFPVEFLFNEANEDLLFQARIKIDYRISWLTGSPEDSTPPDTASATYTFDRSRIKERFHAQIPMKAKMGNQYHVKVTVTDLNRDFSITNYYRLDKQNKYSQQNFQVFLRNENYLLTSPLVVGNNIFRIQYAHDRPDSVFVSYYNPETPLPTISSVTPEMKNKPDSTWKWPFDEHTPYMINRQGIYHIRLDTSSQDGLTLLNFGEFYPLVKRPQEMIPPIQYLANTSEYRNISQHKNVKLAIDNFWLDKAENIERARELIRIYYNRVYFSNYYFTTTREGWKTDRGMVYIIYGPPQAIHKTADKEEWIYFPDGSQSPVSYFFYYHKSPFSINDYRLSRSESTTAGWREALQAWRTGDIFRITN